MINRLSLEFIDWFGYRWICFWMQQVPLKILHMRLGPDDPSFEQGQIPQWIGLREILQENSICHGTIYGFWCRFPLPIHRIPYVDLPVLIGRYVLLRLGGSYLLRPGIEGPILHRWHGLFFCPLQHGALARKIGKCMASGKWFCTGSCHCNQHFDFCVLYTGERSLKQTSECMLPPLVPVPHPPA